MDRGSLLRKFALNKTPVGCLQPRAVSIFAMGGPLGFVHDKYSNVAELAVGFVLRLMCPDLKLHLCSASEAERERERVTSSHNTHTFRSYNPCSRQSNSTAFSNLLLRKKD